VAKEIKDSFYLFLFSSCLLRPRWKYAEGSTVKESTDQLPTLLSISGYRGGNLKSIWDYPLAVHITPSIDLADMRNLVLLWRHIPPETQERLLLGRKLCFWCV